MLYKKFVTVIVDIDEEWPFRRGCTTTRNTVFEQRSAHAADLTSKYYNVLLLADIFVLRSNKENKQVILKDRRASIDHADTVFTEENGYPNIQFPLSVMEFTSNAEFESVVQFQKLKIIKDAFDDCFNL